MPSVADGPPIRGRHQDLHSDSSQKVPRPPPAKAFSGQLPPLPSVAVPLAVEDSRPKQLPNQLPATARSTAVESIVRPSNTDAAKTARLPLGVPAKPLVPIAVAPALTPTRIHHLVPLRPEAGGPSSIPHQPTTAEAAVSAQKEKGGLKKRRSLVSGTAPEGGDATPVKKVDSKVGLKRRKSSSTAAISTHLSQSYFNKAQQALVSKESKRRLELAEQEKTATDLALHQFSYMIARQIEVEVAKEAQIVKSQELYRKRKGSNADEDPHLQRRRSSVATEGSGRRLSVSTGPSEQEGSVGQGVGATELSRRASRILPDVTPRNEWRSPRTVDVLEASSAMSSSSRRSSGVSGRRASLRRQQDAGNDGRNADEDTVFAEPNKEGLLVKSSGSGAAVVGSLAIASHRESFESSHSEPRRPGGEIDAALSEPRSTGGASTAVPKPLNNLRSPPELSVSCSPSDHPIRSLTRVDSVPNLLAD